MSNQEGTSMVTYLWKPNIKEIDAEEFGVQDQPGLNSGIL